MQGIRDKVFIATKTPATTAAGFWQDLETSLGLLQTDHIDIYQFHNPAFCPKPGDGSGLYEAMLEAKAQGKVRFIGITNHRLAVAHEAIESGLYDTLQFPFSYMTTDKELELVHACAKQQMGFIAMKGLAGGLINNSAAAYAYLAQFEHVLPIWGVQRENELDEFLSYIDAPPVLDDALASGHRQRPSAAYRQLLPWLPLLYAVPGRYRDQLLRPYVADDKALPAGSAADRKSPGYDAEDRGLPALRPMQGEMPLWA